MEVSLLDGKEGMENMGEISTRRSDLIKSDAAGMGEGNGDGVGDIGRFGEIWEIALGLDGELHL
ncbi:hypothetical protein KS4_32700 [Poriferisphaera corsica]|uniref:Uncharacterized protein n=1 Tax=Poriferisphaera corsica TaxID=2528020 RepID=A0A517YY80_9BACT|nr:hypothetical protein KS4_32700 [Poriferisphaera corsica]